MIIPIGDEPKPATKPYVNYAFIAINVFVFFVLQPHPNNIFEGVGDRKFLADWAFTPVLFHAHTLLTSMFMHADIWHLGGNMLFLWVAGDNIEDRLGHVWYAVFYLAAGIVATLTHYVFNMDSMMPSLGASGAISAVLGAYFVLCARNRIKILYWFFFIGVTMVPARVAIGVWILMQLLLATDGASTGVAVWAHLGGVAFGLGLLYLLKALGVVKSQVVWFQHGGSTRDGGPRGWFHHSQRQAPPRGRSHNPYSQYSRQRNLFDRYGSDAGVDKVVVTQACEAPAHSFTLIALKPWRANAEAVIDAVATAQGLPFSAVQDRLRGEPGVLARDLDDKQASVAVARLRERGVPALALPKVRLIDMPQAHPIDNVIVGDAAFTLYSRGHDLNRRFRDIFLICAGLIRGDGDARPTVVADVFVYEPWARFRLRESAAPGAEPHEQLSNIRSMIARLMQRGGGISMNRGVRLLLDDGDWTPMTFDSLDAYDRYVYWLMQVVNAKNRKWA